MEAIIRLLTVDEALRLAEKAFEVAGYWGPVRVYYRLVTHDERYLVDVDAVRYSDVRLPAGEHVARAAGSVSELVGREMNVAHQIMDHVWQHMGKRACPWFTEDGDLKPHVRDQLDFL